jgi:Holliday junction resolvasome RuvABC ATP-dependent DNA helicase subunit
VTSFAEQYRPTSLTEFIGNAKAVQAAQFYMKRGLGGLAFWISGGTGLGKTTLARILAASVADPLSITEFDSADQLNQDALNDMSLSMYTLGLGRPGRAPPCKHTLVQDSSRAGRGNPQ